jgi:Winged helix DNA-binding domain
MTRRRTPDIRVTHAQVAAFRLARQHLDTRAPTGMLLSVARDMAGAQAQVLSAAQISLWARVDNLAVDDVEAAVRDRMLVRAWCMRHTLHLVPANDLAVFVRGSAARAERDIRWVRGQGLADRVIEGMIDAALTAMDQPVTRREIAERVSRSLGVRPRAYIGGGWGNRSKIPAVAVGGLTFPIVYLFHLLGARGVICSGPARGTEPTFVRADAWIPRFRDVPRDVAERRLLRRYLQTFGPTTPSEFAYWVGMPLRDARAIWVREESRLASVSIDGTSGTVVPEDLRHLARTNPTPAPARLLPYFDAYLLGSKDREHLVAAAKLKTVYRPQGWVSPVVLVNGRVAGTWVLAREGDRLRIRAAPFAALSRGTVAAIREEAQDLGRFLRAGSVDLHIP